MFETVTGLMGLLIGAGGVFYARQQVIQSKEESRKKDATIQSKTLENKRLVEEIKTHRLEFPAEAVLIDDMDDLRQNEILPIVLLKVASQKEVVVKNFGLDLEAVLPWFANQLMKPEMPDCHISFLSLIINPGSEFNTAFVDGESNIKTRAVENSFLIAKEIEKNSRLNKIKIVLNQYDLPPVIHGCMIDDDYLFLGFTEISEGKYFGGEKPYMCLKRDIKKPFDITTHYFNFFETWFEYYWNSSCSKVIVSIDK